MIVEIRSFPSLDLQFLLHVRVRYYERVLRDGPKQTTNDYIAFLIPALENLRIQPEKNLFRKRRKIFHKRMFFRSVRN